MNRSPARHIETTSLPPRRVGPAEVQVDVEIRVSAWNPGDSQVSAWVEILPVRITISDNRYGGAPEEGSLRATD